MLYYIANIVVYQVMDLQELVRVIPKNVCDWSVQDVAHWLKYIHLQQFQHKFRQKQIDGCALLQLNQVQLSQVLQSKSKIIFKKLKAWIQFLNDNSRAYHNLLAQVVSQVSQFEELEEYYQQFQTECTWSMQDYLSSQLKGNPKRLANQLIGSTQKQCFQHQNLYLYERFGLQNHYYKCTTGKNITIGKAADNSIVFNEPGLELYQSTIIHRKNRHYLKSSTSKKDGIWIKVKNNIKIDKRYIIQMGYTQFEVTPKSDRLILQVSIGQDQTTKVVYTFDNRYKTSIRVGRSTKYELSFPADTTMSGFHGKFTRVFDHWYFEDMQTLNGSWYKCIEDKLISDKLIFRLGKTTIIYECRLISNQDTFSKSSATSVGLCKRCRKIQKNCFFSPCHHSVSCIKCGSSTQTCFECGQQVINVQRMYRS